MTSETRNRKNISPVAPALLAWYEKNARALPWRVGPRAHRAGMKPDPYRVWLSEIMLQQTTVRTVAPRYDAFVKRWPNVEALAAARLDDVLGEWAGLGYYARARNLHKCAILIAAEFGGEFPQSEHELKILPGVGDYTAAAIAAIAFDRRAVVIDGNVERVIARFFAIESPAPKAKAEIRARADAIWPRERSGDFAQGLMDLGALVCRPRAPLCSSCPISGPCAAFAAGAAEAYPIKSAKARKPKRAGAVYILKNARGEMLFERRPEKGLLGGMPGLPGTPWTEQPSDELFACAPARAKWRRIGEVAHTFTHFHLSLDVFEATAPSGFRRRRGQKWIASEDARLPRVMRKALDLAK